MSHQVRSVELLRRNQSPYWYLRWWEPKPDGGWKEKWQSTKQKRKRDAEKQRRQLERKLEGGKNAAEAMTWEEFTKEFLETHAARKAPLTCQAFRESLAIFGKMARPRCLAAIDVGLLEAFANRRLEANASPATVNRDLRHVRAALYWAHRRKYLTERPDFHGVFIREDRKLPITIPEEDFLAMVRALKQPELKLKNRSAGWWRVFLYLSYYTGGRRGEILGLTWDRVSLAQLEVKIDCVTSKGRKTRVVPIAAELGELLREWESGRENTGSQEVLPWPHDSFRSLYDDWHLIQAAAGIPDGQHYAPKNFRSSCASELIRNGIPTSVVKQILGHSHIATTENYYVNATPALRSAMAKRKVALE